MRKDVTGNQVFLDGEAFYKIENYDSMTDFFMTITSSNDVWNFCWAQGGITAGRKNCDFAVFPYYTCDKLQDMKGSTGSVSIIKIKKNGDKGVLWEPFKNLSSTGIDRYDSGINIKRNIYKNLNGSKVWFEEVNLVEGLAFRYGWTSSAKFGLVKMTRIENLTDQKIEVEILDGCRNIMCAASDTGIQNVKSVLLDAYKKNEVTDSNIALFALSSILTDKAEPSEALKANVCWFTTKDPVFLADNAVDYFVNGKESLLLNQKELNGKRGECYIIHNSELKGKSAECWEQVFDVDYDISKLVELESVIKNRDEAWKTLSDDMKESEDKLLAYISSADGVQTSKNEISDLHHRTNVMFNIMRGGIFLNDGKIKVEDFKKLVSTRNKKLAEKISAELDKSPFAKEEFVSYEKMRDFIFATNNSQFKRAFLEYLPITFSRRHGDPSRPWNRFSIELLEKDGSEKISYEGNWRDIFQNWEALLWSYPEYAKNVCSVFLNAMSADGYNPYRISREGIDWEIPEEGNPWAQFGYWTDHQVIYLQKLLEFFANYDKTNLIGMMNEKVFSTANIPYRIKAYNEVYKTPRTSIAFDYKLEDKIKSLEKNYGFDARLILDKDENVQLTTMTTKLLQLVLAKLLNHIPEAGLWMNTQRPEWNDANNALAGFGTSVVTMSYLHRMLKFMSKLFADSGLKFSVSSIVAKTLKDSFKVYSDFYKAHENKSVSDAERKSFTDSNGKIFEAERTELYKNGFGDSYEEIDGKELASILDTFAAGIEKTIKANKREDGLFHSYNSVMLKDDEIKVVNLKLMLEGQVSILSCDVLSKEEKLEVTEKLRKSDLFEEKQHSYMLYPNSRLPNFKDKNNIAENELGGLESFVQNKNQKILTSDKNGVYHFCSMFRNADVLKEYISGLKENKPTEAEEKLLLDLYEKKFNHQTFMGRSGSFYCYEGLGCIYWHLVSKLLVAVQENVVDTKDAMFNFYKDVKKGLGSAKTPDVYGAFPFDPYSHTPYQQGARQPGMTGQVKEEVLSRWGELGLNIQNGNAVFNPTQTEKKDYDADGKIFFTWCGTKVVYDSNKANSIVVKYANGTEATFEGKMLPEKESKMLFLRSKEIESITVGTAQ